MFIPYPDLDFLPIPDPDIDFEPSRILDPGVKKAPDPGSRGQNGTWSRIQGSKRRGIPDAGVKRHRIQG